MKTPKTNRELADDCLEQARFAAADGDKSSTSTSLLGAIAFAVLDVADAVREHAQR